LRSRKILSYIMFAVLLFYVLNTIVVMDNNINGTLMITGNYGRFNNVLIYFAKVLMYARHTKSRLFFTPDLLMWTEHMDTKPNER